MAKKAAPKAAEPKAAPATADKSGPKPVTKTELYGSLADKTGLSKKQVASVIDALHEEVKTHVVGKKGAGVLSVGNLLRIKLVNKPATKARPGFNPATKQPITIKAKPARKVIKILPLKGLKDLI